VGGSGQCYWRRVGGEMAAATRGWIARQGMAASVAGAAALGAVRVEDEFAHLAGTADAGITHSVIVAVLAWAMIAPAPSARIPRRRGLQDADGRPC
jgi:hypothetical protein